MPLTSPILKTKFFPPPVISDFIDREEIKSILADSGSYPVLLFSAPTGYGKSSLVSSWLQHQDHSFAWISLSERENDFQRFVIYFAYAIHAKIEGVGREILDMASLPEMPSNIEIADYFINHLSELNEHFYLVLDDYHLIRNKAIHDFITALTKHPLSRFSIVLITRRDPSLPLSEWRSKNKLLEIREAEFKFKEKEILHFFENAGHANIKSTTLENIQKISEGWISGIRLMLLVLKDKDDVNGEFLGREYHQSHIFQNLLFDVLGKLSSRYREYLLKLSLAGEFNQSLFSKVCLTENEKEEATTIFNEFVDTITNSNLFIIALDNKHQWYRFHHLITDLLHRQLNEEFSNEEIQTLREKIGDWFLQMNDHENGLKYLLQAEKYAKSISVFAALKNTLLASSDWQKLQAVYEWFPSEAEKCYTTLMLAKAWILIYRGNIPEMLKLIEPIEALMEKEDLSLKERNKLQGELHVLKAWDLYNFNVDMEACLYHSRQAINLIHDESSYALGIAWIFYGGALQCLKRSEEAKTHLLQKLANTKEEQLKANLYLILCYIEWLDGHLEQLVKTAHQMELLSISLKSKEVLANSKYFKGMALYFLNQMEEAREELQVAVQHHHFTILVHGFFAQATLAYVHNERGEFEQVKLLLLELEKQANNKGGPVYVDFTKAISSELEWKKNRSPEALKWAQEKSFKPFIPMSNFVSRQLAQLKILATDSNPESWAMGLENAEEVIAFLRETNNSNFLIRTLLVKALLEFKSGEKTKARISFMEALQKASKRNFIQPFLRLKDEVKPLFEEFLDVDSETISEQFIQSVSVNPNGANNRLTNRELEILSKMDENLSNKELGSRLFISESTVKRHIANIFKKLEAKNRHEALAKARELRFV